MSTAINTRQISAVDIDTRVNGFDWTSIWAHLDAHGWATFVRRHHDRKTGQWGQD